MAEPIRISTSKYKNIGKVDIDGHIWDVAIPGPGAEFRFSQAQRGLRRYEKRFGELEKLIDSNKASDEEIEEYGEIADLFEEYEEEVLEYFISMFRDGTEDNSEVRKWVEETPSAVIQAAFEDITRQAKKVKNGRKSPTKRTR